MATASLLSAVAAALSTAATLGYNSGSAAHDVYEGYVLALLLRAATNEGWQWDLRDGSEASTTHAVFRMGPGRLPSGNFTHVYLWKPGRVTLEAHIGVKVAGISSVVHEFDLLVLPAAVASNCRLTNADPGHADVIAHGEAKHYGGNLPLPIGRAMVGLAVECGLNDKSVLVTNRNGVTVERLISHYDVTFRFLIKPSNSRGEYHLVRRFQEFLQAAP